MSSQSTNAPADRSGRAGIRSLIAIAAAAGLGLALADVLHLRHVYQSSSYLYVVTAILAVGVYGSTSGIELAEFRRNRRTILIALTVGVLAKAVLISLVMIVVLRMPLYAILLGVAVAQIDPVSVAAMITKSRMSNSAKTILLAWSSFDDPVTMLLTVYLLAFVRGPGGTGGLSNIVGSGTSPLALLGSIGANIAFAAVVWLAQWAARRLSRARPVALKLSGSRFARAATVAETCWLLAAGVFAVLHFYLLGLAVIGLFLRPRIQGSLGRLTRWALLAATVALGLILTEGVNWLAGIALGTAAFGSQIVTAPLVARRHSFTDRTYLALGQQNGITAITLALLLQPVFPETVGIIAPAILVVNILNLGCDTVWTRYESRRQPTSFASLLHRPGPVPPVPVPAMPFVRSPIVRSVGTVNARSLPVEVRPSELGH